MQNKIKLKKNDMVRVITGKDKGRQGKILFIDRKKNRVIVEGINFVSKHQKPNRTNAQGGIIKKEAAIHISNVMLLHDGEPTKIGYKFENKNGKLVKKRFAKKSGKFID